MIQRRAFLAAPAALMRAETSAFNGRWILKPEREARGRVWWLKVEHAGSPRMTGEFVGFPGGQLDRIPAMRVEGSKLIWQSKDRTYTAEMKGPGIVGEMVAGQERVRFTGARAPELKDRDDGSWKAGKAVELFNGRDLSGWKPIVATEKMNWVVEGGVLKNGQKAINLQSEAEFFNFALRVEFRVANKSNGGLGLRSRYEIQIFGDHGEAPSVHGNGALYSRIPPKVNATLPQDQWQVFEIRLVGRDLTVKLNGKTLHDKVHVEGLTAVATSADEASPGPLSLQGDHGPVEFRKITATPLVR